MGAERQTVMTNRIVLEGDICFKDMTGQTCQKCKKDKYQERSQHDDMDGKVTCSCGNRVDRWKKYKEQGVAENLRAWFGKGKKGGAGGGGWDRYNTKGERIGKCGDAKKSEGKPKCLSKSRAASLRAKGGKKAIAAAVNKKRRDDPNKNRRGKAKNVSNTVKTRKKK